MINLPYPRKDYLIGFLIVMTILFSIIFIFMSSIIVVNKFSLLPLVFLFFIAGIGRLEMILPLYKSWNKMVNLFSEISCKCHLYACYYIIFFAVAQVKRGRLNCDLAPINEGSWNLRQTLESLTYESQFNQEISNGQKNWFINYLKWAIFSKNEWTLFILPNIFAIKILGRVKKLSISSTVYTLF